MSIVLVVDFENFNSIVSQEVANCEWTVIEHTIETKNFPIVVKELLCGEDLAATKFLLHVVEHLGVFLGWDWNLTFHEVVNRASLSVCLGLTEILYEEVNK